MNGKDMKDKLKKIKLLLMDVDGVLTDGKLHINDEGIETKSFHVHDGTGIKLLREFGVMVGFVSGRRSIATAIRGKELGVELIWLGIKDKESYLKEFLECQDLTTVAYIGDDINDALILEKVGFSVAVANAHEFIKSKVDYITTKEGGNGAVREVCDMIIGAKNE